MNEPAHAVSVPRTLRLKVRPEAYRWLNAAALEVNSVSNWANETTSKAEYFARIGADTIQRVNGEHALERSQFKPAAA